MTSGVTAQPAAQPRTIDVPFLVIAVSIVFVVFANQRVSIPIARWLNPDEGELMAAGKRAAQSFIPFKDFTSTSYGPLWPFVLSWLHRFGLPLTIPVAHLLNALIFCAVAVLVAHRVRTRWGLAASVLTVSPLVVHWSRGFVNRDFLSLCTETLPVLFLVLGCTVAFSDASLTTRRATIAAALFGSAVWSKYSFAMVAAIALLALVCAMVTHGHHIRRAVLAVAAASLAPFVLLVSWARVMAVPWWKITESIDYTLDYIRIGRRVIDVGKPLGDPIPLSTRIHNVADLLPRMWGLLPLVGLCIWALINQSPRNAVPSVRALRPLALAGVVVALLSLVSMGQLFAHYAYLVIAAVVLAVFLLSSLPPSASDPGADASPRLVALLAALVLVVSPALITQRNNFIPPLVTTSPNRTSWSQVLTSEGGLIERATTTDGRLISLVCPRGSRVIVWGWAPDLYSQYDWVPATRYVTNIIHIRGLPYASHFARYRERLLSDFRREQPDCVVDASTRALFPGWGPENGLARQWPAFVTELNTSYQMVPSVFQGSSPFTIWVHNT